MKKFLALAVSCVALFGFAAGAGAQGFDAGVKLGYADLAGDAGDAFDGAFAGGIYLNYSYNPNIAAQLSWLYHKHDQSDELNALTDFLASEELGVPALADIRLVMNQFDLNGIYKFPMNQLTPYVLAGVGLNYWKLDGKVIVGGFDAKDDESFWDFELNVGGGLNFAVTPQVKVGGEFIYTYVFDEFDEGTYSILGTISYGFAM